VLFIRLIFRVETDLKFCTIAPKEPDLVPLGRAGQGEAFFDKLSRAFDISGQECFAPTEELIVFFGDNDYPVYVIWHYDKNI
jgi:hypothetical protein